MNAELSDAVGRACGSAVTASRAVPGGDINAAMRIDLADGRSLFVKHSGHSSPRFYAAEAAGLRWLAEASALPVPEAVAVDERFLALEWIESGGRAAGFDEALGRGLAALHRAGAERHGATGEGAPTFIGSLEVPNGAEEGWPAFYGRQRLAPLARMARDAGGLSADGVRRVERVIERLGEVCGPEEPPARLHGDLWSGNVMAGPDGGPWLLDPAAYGGHREIDLAMLSLFGRPGPGLLAAYEEVWPLAEGHAERVDLYQLLPLLVHAALFGGGYGASAERAAARYA